MEKERRSLCARSGCRRGLRAESGENESRRESARSVAEVGGAERVERATSSRYSGWREVRRRRMIRREKKGEKEEESAEQSSLESPSLRPLPPLRRFRSFNVWQMHGLWETL